MEDNFILKIKETETIKKFTIKKTKNSTYLSYFYLTFIFLSATLTIF